MHSTLLFLSFAITGLSLLPLRVGYTQSAETNHSMPQLLGTNNLRAQPGGLTLTPPLARQVSLEPGNMSLKQALDEIDRQADLRLSYSAKLVPLERRISIRRSRATAAEALEEALRGTDLTPAVTPSGLVMLVKRTPRPQPSARAQTGTVLGVITDSATGQPLPNGQVMIAGTSRSASTNDAGEYRLGDVPAGVVTLRALRIGYAAAAREVTVPDGGEVRADFVLAASVVQLNEVVTTITGEKQRRELANAISTINADSVVPSAPITNVSELLNGRATGVTVLQSSGGVGNGSRIRIRGSNSASLNNQPIVYVDGARVYSAPTSTILFTGGQEPSRVDDINPQDIESIEIVKGPSAATLYGTDAANGVILITTKLGQAGGRARWNAFATVGVLKDPYENNYPLNYGGLDGPDPLTAVSCFAFMVSQGLCQQQALLAYQPLNDPVVGPIAAGNHQQYGLSVAGGRDAFNYYVSADWMNEVGPVELSDSVRTSLSRTGTLFPWQTHPNELRRVNLRANFGVRLPAGFGVSASTGYTTSKTQRLQNDDNGLGLITNGLGGSFSPSLGFGGHGFAVFAPHETFVVDAPQDVDRFTGSIQGTWQPPSVSWLSARATVGFDRTQADDGGNVPNGAITRFGPALAAGQRVLSQDRNYSYSGDASVTASTALTSDVSSRTTVGGQYFRTSQRLLINLGIGVVPFTSTLTGAATQIAVETGGGNATLGFFAEQQFAWRNRLFLTGGLRADDNSSFGQDFNTILYPKVGASYVAVDDVAGRPWLGVLDLLRLRATVGAAGVSPNQLAALTFLEGSNVVIAGVPTPGVTFGNPLGNNEIKPERSREIELGFDGELLHRRLGLEFTYYHKKTKDALISRELAPSVGIADARVENIGSVLNKGLEVALNVQALQRRNVQWDGRISAARNINRLVELGAGVAPITLFTGNQQHVPGHALGAYWDYPVSFSDANGDGVITPDEITRGDQQVFLGNIFPRNELSLSTDVTLFNRLRVGVLFDHRGDFVKYNGTEDDRCATGICRGLNDPSASLREQARAVNSFSGAAPSTALYIEDASFWKFRELSFTLFAPGRWAHALGADRLELVVTGRNLKTWTDYSGLDPESNGRGQENFLQQDFYTQPPARTWLARINVGF